MERRAPHEDEALLEGGAEGGGEAEPRAPTDRRSLCVSMFMLVLSIPALIGSCWPALVIGLLSGTASGAARKAGHAVSLAVTLTVMTGFTGYLWFKARTQRPPPHWHKYGPTYLTALAGVLISLDIVRHVLKDHGINYLGRLNLTMYRSDCDAETLKCLTPIGYVVTIGCTYLGFVLLAVAVAWNSELLDKCRAIRERWRELRTQPDAEANA